MTTILFLTSFILDVNHKNFIDSGKTWKGKKHLFSKVNLFCYLKVENIFILIPSGNVYLSWKVRDKHYLLELKYHFKFCPNRKMASPLSVKTNVELLNQFNSCICLGLCVGHKQCVFYFTFSFSFPFLFHVTRVLDIGQTHTIGRLVKWL